MKTLVVCLRAEPPTDMAMLYVQALSQHAERTIAITCDERDACCVA